MTNIGDWHELKLWVLYITFSLLILVNILHWCIAIQ